MSNSSCLRFVVAALTLSVVTFFAHAEEVISLNSPNRREFENETISALGVELTQSITTTGTFNRVTLKLGSQGFKIHSQNSLVVFKNRSILEATANFGQYNGDDGNFNRSYIAVDGTLIVKPNGYSITLPRIKAYNDKTAAILVVGEGELIANDSSQHNVTIVRPEDVTGMIITLWEKE